MNLDESTASEAGSALRALSVLGPGVQRNRCRWRWCGFGAREHPSPVKLDSLAALLRTGAAMISPICRPFQAQSPKRLARLMAERGLLFTSDGIIVADLVSSEMPIVYVNKAFEDITGYSDCDVIGKNCLFLQGSDQLQPEIMILRDALERRETVNAVMRNYRKNGSMFWNDLKLVPVFGPGKIASHYIGVIRDVTALMDIASKFDRAVCVDPQPSFSVAAHPGNVSA